ncbi:MAG: hypothetical protein AB8B85_10050 [Paracoccaceae bacterium]
MAGLAFGSDVKFEDVKGSGFKIILNYEIKSVSFTDVNLKVKLEKEWVGGDIYKGLSENGRTYYIKKLEEIWKKSFKKWFDDKAGAWQLHQSEKNRRVEKAQLLKNLKAPFSKFEKLVDAKAENLVKGVKDKLLRQVQMDGKLNMKAVRAGAVEATAGGAGMIASGAAAGAGGGPLASLGVVSAGVTTAKGLNRMWTARVKNGKKAKSELKNANTSLQEASDAFGALELAAAKLKAQIKNADAEIAKIQTSVNGNKDSKNQKHIKDIKAAKAKLEKASQKSEINNLGDYKALMTKLGRAQQAMSEITTDVVKLEDSVIANAQETLALVQTIQSAVRALR